METTPSPALVIGNAFSTVTESSGEAPPRAVATLRRPAATPPESGGAPREAYVTSGIFDKTNPAGFIEEAAPEFYHPITILAVDPLTGVNKAFPSIDQSFLPALENVVRALAAASAVTAQSSLGTSKPLAGLPGSGLFAARRGPKGKKVIVTAIDTDVYTGSITKFAEFDTGMAASQALGASYNSVNKALHNSGGAPVQIDGVTFEYSETYMERVNADVRCD